MKVWIGGLILMFMGQVASASGCFGGRWQEIGRKQLPDTEILTSHYGEAEVKADVWEAHAYVTYQKVGTKTDRLSFFSGMFELSKVDLVELLRKLKFQRPSFFAETTQVISVNPYYDDCMDIPENTKETTIYYTFSVVLENGYIQRFTATHTEYDPPLERKVFGR